MATKKIQIINSLVKQAENANTLGGKSAEEFALASDITTMNARINELVASSESIVPYEYIFKENEVNVPDGVEISEIRIISNGCDAVIILENVNGSIENILGPVLFTIPDDYLPFFNNVGYTEHSIYADEHLKTPIGYSCIGGAGSAENVSSFIIHDIDTEVASNGVLKDVDIYMPYHLATPLPIPELVDLRVGIDGTTYTSAGEAVRTQIKNLTPPGLPSLSEDGYIVFDDGVSPRIADDGYIHIERTD